MAAGSEVVVLICADLGKQGLDLAALQWWAQEALATCRVDVVPDLCRLGNAFSQAVRSGEASRLVLGLCDRPSSLSHFQARLRRAGVDPPAVEVVNLGGLAARVHPQPLATEKTKLLLAGAVARARAFRASRPEQWKPVLPAAVTRRAIVSWSVFEYHPVPSVNQGQCRVATGCSLCVDACPHAALKVTGNAVYLERADCTSCGVCVTACPHGAVEMPGSDPSQLGAQVTALLRAPASLEPRGILFACSNSLASLEALAAQRRSYLPNWLPVEVPCLGMVPPGWMLAPLGLGAAAVAILPCQGRCRSGQQEAVAGRVAYCREVLRVLGEGEARVILLPSEGRALADALRSPMPPSQVNGSNAPDQPFAPGAAADVLLQLAGAGAESLPPIPHPYSPFGRVEIGEGCTLCSTCTAACPTDALAMHQDGTESRLTFTPARCVACGRCVSVCPEPDTLRMHRVTDFRLLGQGPVALRRAAHRRCERCGAPIAPEPMLQRIIGLIGGEDAPGARLVGRLCLDCRGHGFYNSLIY